MFSNQLDRVRHPLASRSRGVVLGSILMIAVAAALASARTVAVSFWITIAAFILAALFRSDVDWRGLRPGPAALCIAVFLAYALLSAAWAQVPSLPLEKASAALLIAASSMLVIELIRNETRPNLYHMGEGLYLGLLVGVIYLVAESFSDQAIKLWLYRALELAPGDLNPARVFTWDGSYLVAISREDLNRNMTDAVLFMWPAMMAVKGIWAGNWRRAGVALLVLLTAVMVIYSEHESSKLALAAGVTAFVMARLSLRWTARIAAATWITACLAVLPLVLLAYRADLQSSTWLQSSARHRIIIWNATAERTLQAPVVGVGANMTYVLGPQFERLSPELFQQPLAPTLSIHSHSIYLQTWFELGAVGALLLTFAGLAILRAIRSLSPRLQSYGYATFASAAAMAAVSYGMWQGWFMGSFGLCAILFALGARCLTKDASDNAAQSGG